MSIYRLQYSGGSGSQMCYFSIAAASADDLAREWQRFASNSQIVSTLFMSSIDLILEVHADTVVRRDARGVLTIEYEDGSLKVDDRGWPVGLGIEVPADLDEWDAFDWLCVDPTAEDRLLCNEPQRVTLDLASLDVPILEGERRGDYVVLNVDGQQIKHPWGLVGDMCEGHHFEAA